MVIGIIHCPGVIVSNPTETDAAYVRRVMEQTCAAVVRGDHPFATIAVGADSCVPFERTNICARTGDPTDRAEMHVLRTAAHRHGIGRLNGASLYVNAEPCTMCPGTILAFGETDGFKSYPSASIFGVAGDRIEGIGGVVADESVRPFGLWIQHRGIEA